MIFDWTNAIGWTLLWTLTWTSIVVGSFGEELQGRTNEGVEEVRLQRNNEITNKGDVEEVRLERNKSFELNCNVKTAVAAAAARRARDLSSFEADASDVISTSAELFRHGIKVNYNAGLQRKSSDRSESYKFKTNESSEAIKQLGRYNCRIGDTIIKAFQVISKPFVIFVNGTSTDGAKIDYDASTIKSKVFFEVDLPAKLVCSVVAFPPVNSISWTQPKNSYGTIEQTESKTEDGVQFVNLTLSFEAVENHQDGDFVCEASNKEGSSKAVVSVKVRNPLAALWPFCGILIEVTVLTSLIMLCEKYQKRKMKKKRKKEEEENMIKEENKKEENKNASETMNKENEISDGEEDDVATSLPVFHPMPLSTSSVAASNTRLALLTNQSASRKRSSQSECLHEQRATTLI